MEVKNVSFGYDEKKNILSDFSASFNENSITCVLGKSGGGKSTLLRIISGLLKPSSGEVIYNGKNITKPIDSIFMMHQAYTNFPWKNCIKNVLFPVQLKRKITTEDVKNAEKMLERVGLKEHIYKYPDELSGGMKQRLALARVLMSCPPVILMDEPLSALDDVTRKEMQDLIMLMNKETKNTIVMVTHNINDANKMADNIIKL